MVTLADIQDARSAIADRIHHTPLLSSRALGERTGTELFIKAEALQKTGSFKVRGALNKVRQLSEQEKSRGLVAVSAGNHAQALAFAASAEGVDCTVVMPEHAPRSKVAASEDYGAEVVLHGTVFDAFDKCDALREEYGYTFVHPYDDEQIIAGQGTVGLEVLDDLAEPDAIVVPVGGGGLLSGIATAVKQTRPKTRVIGVEPIGAAGLQAALEAGGVVDLERVETIADGLAAPATGERVLQHVDEYVDELQTTSDEDIVEALRFTLQRAKLLTEPAGAAAIAGLLSRSVELPRGATVVAIASGGNIDLSKLRELLG